MKQDWNEFMVFMGYLFICMILYIVIFGEVTIG